MKFICNKSRNLVIWPGIKFDKGIYETDDEKKIAVLTGEIGKRNGVVAADEKTDLSSLFDGLKTPEAGEGQNASEQTGDEGNDTGNGAADGPGAALEGLTVKEIKSLAEAQGYDLLAKWKGDGAPLKADLIDLYLKCKGE
jgi:hypothetical protein